MYLVTQNLVDAYSRHDRVTEWLDAFSRHSDEALVCQNWLRQTQAKRFIFDRLYGDLFTTIQGLKLLDVGGGLTAMTRELALRHSYILADLLAHDNLGMAQTMMVETKSNFLHARDWATLEATSYDLVIANDIFPNVDQRLDIFLQRFLPVTKYLRLSLTYYDVPRYYMTRRVDADEILCVLAWNGEHLASVLSKYRAHIINADFNIFENVEKSVFANGRQVCVIELAGGLLRQVPE